MRSITIEARSLESAQGLYEALSEFNPVLVEGFRVSVELGSLDHRLLSVLDAVEQYTVERNSSAHVELDGRRYTLHPDSPDGGSSIVQPDAAN